MSEKLPFCECGCGNRVSREGNKFIRGHNSKKPDIMKVCKCCDKEFITAGSYQKSKIKF